MIIIYIVDTKKKSIFKGAEFFQFFSREMIGRQTDRQIDSKQLRTTSQL